MNNLPGNFPALADWWIRPSQVFCGDVLSADKVIRISKGRVSQVADRKKLPEDALVVDVEGCVTPGFFDVQINGGGGVLFNAEPNEKAIEKIASAHRLSGTTKFLPTIITDTPDVLDKAAKAVSQVFGKYGVAGLHIEGPHISLARRGTHLAKFIRPLDEQTVSCIRGLRSKDIPVLITLAPESATPAQVSELVEIGTVVSIGHSDALCMAANQLLEAGATAFTHLFNAMSPMENRAPGVTGAAINSSAYCSFICDGVHVDDEMLKLAIRARPAPDRMVLISDAMPTVGGPDHFTLYGKTLDLLEDRIVNSEGSLAGAHTTMGQSLARVIANLDTTLEEALKMAVSNPARMLGIADVGTLIGCEYSELVQILPTMECKPLSDALVPVSQ